MQDCAGEFQEVQKCVKIALCHGNVRYIKLHLNWRKVLYLVFNISVYLAIIYLFDSLFICFYVPIGS